MNFYNGKKVLITGSTGFKGSWLSLRLHSLGANVIGYSLQPNTTPSLFNLLDLEKKITQYYEDINDYKRLEQIVKMHQPEILFHLAAQPLVRESYKNPVYTMQTNVMGTVNILEIIKEHHFIKGGVIITTDKVYENKERVYPYRETDRLGGHDPYSSSKAMAELACNSYKKSFLDSLGKKIAVVRAGNVIGGGDRCNDRLIPDIIRSCYQKESLVLRNPHAVRPWQYVLEALHGYLMIGEKLFIDDVYCTTYNFGPNQEDTMKVVDIVDKAIEILEVGSYTIDSKENRSMHEAHLLLLDTNKAKTLLGWEQKYNVSQALEKTLIRYKKYYDHEDILNTCLNEINYYI